jgi:transcriptional antiterminator NusG
VTSEPNSAIQQGETPEGVLPPASAETAPVALPGAPPPPTLDSAQAGRELGTSVAVAVGGQSADPHSEPSSGGTEPFVAGASSEEDLSEDEPSDIDDEPEADLPFAAPLEMIDETVADENLKFEWYILKVQVNREDSIKDTLWRRVRMNGIERFFKEIVVPTEDVVEFTKTGKRRVVKKKLYPGYILVNMAVSDESWFIVRETPGIGDFTGSAGKPTPMETKDVERILRSSKVLPEEEGADVKTTIPFKEGDRVRVKEGYFQNFEGDVHSIDQAHGRVKVMINIFGRATPVDIEHWMIEQV